jgi:hypothetical protein
MIGQSDPRVPEVETLDNKSDSHQGMFAEGVGGGHARAEEYDLARVSKNKFSIPCLPRTRHKSSGFNQ